MQVENDIRIYEYILQKQKLQVSDIKLTNNAYGFLTHFLFKAIVIGIYYFRTLMVSLTSDLITQQLNVIFVIVDFWFTKNVNGRRLIGLRWFFGEDEHGIQRFMFEVRINDDYENAINSKLFWVIQIIYIMVPIIQISTTFFIINNFNRISIPDLAVNLIVIAGGVANLFLFYKANASAMDRKMEFKRQYGREFLRKLGPNSIVSFL